MSVFNKIVIRILPFIMIVIIAKGAILMTIYNMNQTVFTELFCENKAKPELQCNGHCKLSKIANSESQDKKKSHPGEINFETQVFVYSDFAFNKPFIILPSKETSKAIPFKESVYSYLFINKPFHPPTALS